MDNELYTDSFEQLLKEQADRFTMRPTKRIWHSIYNDLHPARKWPSVAISLLLVISMLLLGYLNTNDGSQNTTTDNLANNLNGKQANSNVIAKQTPQQTVDPTLVPDNASSNHSDDNTLTIKNDIAKNSKAWQEKINSIQHIPNNIVLPQAMVANQQGRRTSRQSSVRAIQNNSQSNSTLVQPQSNNGNAQPIGNVGNRMAGKPVINGVAGQTNNNDVTLVNRSNNNTTTQVQNNVTGTSGNTGNIVPASPNTPIPNTQYPNTTIPNTATEEPTDADNIITNNATNNDITASSIQVAATDKEKAALQNKIALATDKAWIDNYAFYNKPIPSKWKNKISWQVYITPSFTYRTLFENTVAEGRTSLQNLVTNPFARQAGLENSVEHKPGPSAELGAAIVLDVAKKWQIRFGTQVNYTSYFASANKINHPINTNISVNNLFTGSLDIQSQSASISNTPGSNISKLNNYTVQLALPIGFAYKLAGNEDLKFYVGATVQPSFILSGSSPMLSSDRLFYVDNNTKQGDASFIRRFNVAMGIETFASYRMGEYTFLAGPQIRYQLLTTNNHKFTVGEKLYNIGLKLGIAKRF